MASQRPQRNRRPPVFYGQEQEEDTFLQFQPPSPPKKPIDTRPPFDPDLVEECAFPSLNPVTHVGPGPSEVYKLRRQVREQQELKQMVEYEPWYHERIAKLSLRKRVVGRRDIGPFPGDVVEKASKGDKASRARSRGVSVEQVTYADTREDRLRWEKSREQELVWAVGSSSEGEEEEQEEEEEEEDNIQQRDMDVKTFRLLLTARNVNHRKQKEAVAAVEKARSHALSLATSQGRVNLVLPPASTLATAAGENQRDHDGDAVMGGGSLSQSTRQLVESLPKARWQFTIERWPKSPRRPTAAEKGKGKEVLPGEVSTIQSTMGPRRMSEGITRCFDGIDPLGVESPTVQILNTACLAIPDWPSLPANIQYLITYLLTAVHVPPYSFAQMSTLLSLSSDEIISLLCLINQETRKMVVLDNLSKQLAAIEKINAVRDALDRLKPRCLITDSVSPEDICQGQAFLRCMGLHEVAEWLAEYMGVSSRGRWYDDESRYVIKINGRLLDGDIPAEVASNVLGRIWREEQERANRFEKAGRAEAARASMRPPPPGLVNRSVLEIPLVHRSPDKDNVLTAQEAEQAARRLAELGLLVPEPGHYTVSVNGECVHLEEGLQARRIWNKELEAMRQAQRHRQQHAMAPPPRPAPREPKSPNSQTKDDLLSIGIDLSLHKPPSVYTGSPTLEARTAQFMAANKDLLAAIDKEDEEKDRLLRVIDDERGSRDVSEARTLRSNSVYSSRFPSEAPPVVPAATTTARTARNNRQANTVPANPSSSAHEIARRRQAELSREEGPSHAAEGTAQDNRERTNNPRRQVKNPVRERGPEKPRKPQAATEAGASNGTPHNASAGRSGSSRPVATAVTTQKEEARPVPVPTPSASETPASQKKTKFILKVGGRRVVSQSHITFKDTPATEPPVHASPPTLRRNLSEPTRRHRDISQERSFGGNATRDAPSPGSFNHSLPTRRSLFGTTREQQLSYLTSGTLNVSHDARGRVPTPPLGVFRHPPRAIRHQSHHQMPPPAGFPNRALTESGSHHQNESRPTGHLPSITPARTISPQVPSQAVAGRESPQTMRGTATEDIGKRHATRRQFHGEEQGGRGP